MALPPIQRENIFEALKAFDESFRHQPEWQDWERRYEYAINVSGRRYPAKQILSMAANTPPSEFSGGEQTNKSLRDAGFKIVEISNVTEEGKSNDGGERSAISSRACGEFGRYRSQQIRWENLPDKDRATFVEVQEYLKQIAEFSKRSSLAPDAFSVVTTSGFHPAAGIRGAMPKDLWVSVINVNSEPYVGMPQIYAIFSSRGVELGFAAAIHPNDFSNTEIKRKLRNVAPRLFAGFPSAENNLTHSIQTAMDDQGYWYIRDRTRAEPKQSEFNSLPDLINDLKSPSGQQRTSGALCRYFSPSELDSPDFDLEREFNQAVDLFGPLMLEIAQNLGIRKRTPPVASDSRIRPLLENIMEVYQRITREPYSVNQELWSHFAGICEAFQRSESIKKRSDTIKVSWSVGRGNWAKVPWIAFLDGWETTSTMNGVYCVLLFNQDMSGVHMTFNQGVTRPLQDFGQSRGRDWLRENVRRLGQFCDHLPAREFNVDSDIDLHAEPGLGQNYEVSTVAHKFYSRDSVPEDNVILDDLEAVLRAYDRYLEAKVGTEGPALPKGEDEPYTIEEAVEGLFMPQIEYERILNLWRNKKNAVLQGPPGVGKTFIAKRLAYSLIGFKTPKQIEVAQFHQSYSYEDFVQGYRPFEGGFELRSGRFHAFCQKALDDPENTYVFIIDEINRGNLSKVFGELLVLIEPDKRNAQWAIPLTYASPSDDPFFIPENLFLLGMMNLADRSLAVVDYALRRRFAFATLRPEFASPEFRILHERNGVAGELTEKIISRMNELNEAITEDEVNLGEDFQIGHSFFTPISGEGPFDNSWYQRVMSSEIIPLLNEYWFDNREEVQKWRDRLLS
jgi:hypothetical protein